MPEELPIPDDLRIPFPLMELKISENPGGGRCIAYQKRFQFVALRDLAHDLLDRAVEADKQKDEDEYSDLVAVVLLLTASLECFLNDMLIAHSHNAYGEDYKQVAEGFLGGSLRSRLLRLIPIASKSQKRLDHGHHAVGFLLQLIKTRNRLSHTVEYYVDSPPWEDVEDQPLGKSLSFEICSHYAESLDNYFAAVLSGMYVLKGRKPWGHEMVLDGKPDLQNKNEEIDHP